MSAPEDRVVKGIDLKTLIAHNVQYGHETKRLNPKMLPFIWGQKNGVHLIDVSKTAFQLEKAAQFLESVASQGKPVLLVGTKKAAQECIRQTAQKLGLPYVVHRWIGGTITNYSQVKKQVTKFLHFEDVLAKSSEHAYTKKELGIFQKNCEKLHKNVGGIRTLTWPIGALVIVDAKKEHVAVKEAQRQGIPIVAIVDTNCDPSGIDYVIPANDDVVRSIAILIEVLAQALGRGKAVAEQAKPAQEETGAEHMIEQLIERALGSDEEEEENKAKRKGAPRAAAPRSSNTRTKIKPKEVTREE
ncbi:MAG: 30S ribosomal protein S2 [Candidatus Babeliaceae bacterium]